MVHLLHVSASTTPNNPSTLFPLDDAPTCADKSPIHYICGSYFHNNPPLQTAPQWWHKSTVPCSITLWLTCMILVYFLDFLVCRSWNILSHWPWEHYNLISYRYWIDDFLITLTRTWPSRSWSTSTTSQFGTWFCLVLWIFWYWLIFVAPMATPIMKWLPKI